MLFVCMAFTGIIATVASVSVGGDLLTILSLPIIALAVGLYAVDYVNHGFTYIVGDDLNPLWSLSDEYREREAEEWTAFLRKEGYPLGY